MNSPSALPPLFDPNKTFLPFWRQAYQWLNQCHVLAPEANRILSLPASTIEDLAVILTDGIVLCNLLNYLVPGVINYTDVSFRPQKSRFLCLQNIRLFLDTCRRELNFRDRDLFDPYMLFDKYDLDKIIETLSKISRLDIAKRKNLTPFPINSPVNYANVAKEDANGMLPTVRSLDETVPTQDTPMMNNDDDDDSRALLYYASPETIVSPTGQNDLYGRIIEKKRVGSLKKLCFAFLVLLFVPTRTLCFLYLLVALATFCTLFYFFVRPPKLQRQSSLCHSCRYARIHHVPSFHTTNLSPTTKQESSFIKTTSSTNLTEALSSASLVAANAASTLSSAAATTDKNSTDLITLTNRRLSTSSLPFSILNGDSGVYGSHISIADDVYEQLCEKQKRPDNHKAFLPRDHCVKELLDTELNYRDSLYQIVTHFIEPLPLKIEEKKNIFLNISDIYALHSEFYEDLRAAGRNEKGRTSRIVDLFTKWQDRFLIYAKYCSELPDAQEFLDRKIKQDSSFAQKLEQCRLSAGELGKFQLRDTVVLPFQRIVKYSLLLHTMKKNVPTTDLNGDTKRQILEKAEQLMIDVNQYINESKRAHDNLKVINNIEKRICDIKLPSDRCLRSYGRFIADEQFAVSDDGHRSATRTVFLFDRVLLICKVKGSEKYTFRAALFIQGCQIEELKTAKREFPFILRDNMKHEYRFVAKTEEKRAYWLKHLRDAIDRCSNPELFENGHYFQMKSFDEINPRCDLCNRYLCGIFYQGYECSRCQKKLHRECIKKLGSCFHRASLERIRSFDRGSIELPRAFSSASNVNNHNRVYALYDYDGSINNNNNNNKSNVNRCDDRHIKVNEGDELEIIEDDDEHMWKVKNLRSNEIGLIPATLVGAIDGDLPKTNQRQSTTLAETSSLRSNISSTLAHHFPFIRSLVQAYSPPTSKRTPYGNTYSNPPSTNNNTIPIQRSKSISSAITPENISYKHRTLQLSSSFDNKHLSPTFVPILSNNGLYDWYLDISRHQAEDILRNEAVPNNTFLVRKQGKNEGHAISIKHNDEVYHIRIYTQEIDGSVKHYLVDSLLFDSLQSLVQYYQTHSLEDRFPPVKSPLVYPIALMAEYISVRSNWPSLNSLSLDLICDVSIEETQQSTMMDKQEDTNDDINTRKTNPSDENITSVILRSNQTDEREDPIIILSVLQPAEYRIISIQVLSNARHIEFYDQEYIGSSQGSRITELDSESIYESNFEFNQIHKSLTLKYLKLADITQLVVYCLQINLTKVKATAQSLPLMNLPFDFNRVRSMIDETNLSSNARQFMNNLQHTQEQRRTKETSPQDLNLAQLMFMMKGMNNNASANAKQLAPEVSTPILKEIKTLNDELKISTNEDNDNMKQELNALESRLQTNIDQRFSQLQQYIDDRFNCLEQKLTSLIR
ncbi:unnamed protein product [Rotaria socialis]|uniref:Uncharacterized protein n=2 Tax=Rotaria socialis TaxID=392032 RepID=A0A820SI52_9BILA|nr:unnamed protein product [Rotaria socialis]